MTQFEAGLEAAALIRAGLPVAQALSLTGATAFGLRKARKGMAREQFELPTPEQISERAAEVQAWWWEKERRSRCVHHVEPVGVMRQSRLLTE